MKHKHSIMENQEHREAFQQETNKTIDDFKETLSKEDKAKYDAVDKAMRILSDANVKTYMFPMLKYQGSKGKEVSIQYNNFEKFIKYNGGKMTNQSIIDAQYDNLSFFYSTLVTYNQSQPLGGLEHPDEGPRRERGPQQNKSMSTPGNPESAPVAVPPPSSCSAYNLARTFHETYERLAPAFGYETREDTKTWNPDSRNGRLMAAVCAELIEEINKQLRQIAEMPEYDQDDAHRLRGMARAFLLQNTSVSGPCPPDAAQPQHKMSGG